MSPSLELPLIDVSSFLTPSSPSARADAAQKLGEAVRRYGFFYITGLKTFLSAEETRGVLETAKEFFDAPREVKDAVKVKPGDGARGYQRLGENVTQYKADWHEGLDLYAPVPRDLEDPNRLLHGPNQWPSSPSRFRATFEAWVGKMDVLGKALMEMSALALGIEEGSEEWNYLKTATDDSFWVMRAIGYPTLPAEQREEEGVSCGVHKDYGCWTLLHADECKGSLQVFYRDPQGPITEGSEQGHWILADPIPGALVCNIGEMWETWSNGLWKATLHRVVHRGERYRVSIPFFYEPAYDAVVKPLPSALRLQRSLGLTPPGPQAADIAYLKHLERKVGGNFAFEEVAA